MNFSKKTFTKIQLLSPPWTLKAKFLDSIFCKKLFTKFFQLPIPPFIQKTNFLTWLLIRKSLPKVNSRVRHELYPPCVGASPPSGRHMGSTFSISVEIIVKLLQNGYGKTSGKIVICCPPFFFYYQNLLVFQILVCILRGMGVKPPRNVLRF